LDPISARERERGRYPHDFVNSLDQRSRVGRLEPTPNVTEYCGDMLRRWWRGIERGGGVQKRRGRVKVAGNRATAAAEQFRLLTISQ
jgi:hypothetical protein